MWRLLAVAGMVLVAGCADDDGSGPEPATAQAYALLHDPEWELQAAVDPKPDDPLASVERPPLDWYAEFVRWPSANESNMVRLSGHATSFDESVAQLTELTFELEDTEVDGWRAAGGSTQEAGGADLLVLEHGDRSIIVLSHEVSLDVLVDVASRIEPADAAAWEAAGGVVR